jgi:NodT family efflux transporter outer membrane factor (OMF) lipoprotein
VFIYQSGWRWGVGTIKQGQFLARDEPRVVRRRATIKRLAVLMTLTALAGCSVGPNFVAPEVPIAGSFRHAGHGAIKSSDYDDAKWWNAFHDPILGELVQAAYGQNLTLLSAGTRVLQARAILGVSVGYIYPQVQQASGSVIGNRSSAATPLAGPNAVPQTYWTDAAGVMAGWELDFWGKFRRGVESADAAYLATIASYDSVLVSMLADVTATYIGIRTAERLIAIAQNNVLKQKQALSIATAKYKGGGTSERDVFQAQNVLSYTQSYIPQLTIQLEQLQNALCVLLGVPPQSFGPAFAHLRGRIPLPRAKVVVGIPADLLRRRPDVRAAELAAMAQSAQIGVAAAELYPAISISGSFGGTASTANGHNLGQIFTSKGMTYAGGPAFKWNILNYGQITNNVRLQDAKLQQLLVDYQNTVLAAQQQVDNGLVTFIQSQEQVRLLRQSANAASGALSIAMVQYEQGATDFTTVLTAEQNLFNAEINLATAISTVSLGLASVYRALGGGWQTRNDDQFVDAATARQMRARTDWGVLLPPPEQSQPPAPGLPGPGDIGPTVRLPEW